MQYSSVLYARSLIARKDTTCPRGVLVAKMYAGLGIQTSTVKAQQAEHEQRS